jgi:hypothetical protein
MFGGLSVQLTVVYSCMCVCVRVRAYGPSSTFIENGSVRVVKTMPSGQNTDAKRYTRDSTTVDRFTGSWRTQAHADILKIFLPQHYNTTVLPPSQSPVVSCTVFHHFARRAATLHGSFVRHV